MAPGIDLLGVGRFVVAYAPVDTAIPKLPDVFWGVDPHTHGGPFEREKSPIGCGGMPPLVSPGSREARYAFGTLRHSFAKISEAQEPGRNQTLNNKA